MHGECRAVLALSDHDAADTDDPSLAGGQVALQVGIVLLAVRRGHEMADILAGDVAQRIAEQPLGGGAQRLDPSLLIDDDHGVRNGLQDRPQSRLRRLQRKRHRHGLGFGWRLEAVKNQCNRAVGGKHGHVHGRHRRSAGGCRSARRDERFRPHALRAARLPDELERGDKPVERRPCPESLTDRSPDDRLSGHVHHPQIRIGAGDDAEIGRNDELGMRRRGDQVRGVLDRRFF